MRAALLLLLMLLPAAAQAQTSLDADQLREVGIEQRIEQQIPLDASFVDEQGRDVQLREFFADEKPVVLALVYNRCPMLCNMVLSGLISTLRVMKLEPGKDFEVLAVSFDSKEPFTVAARKACSISSLDQGPGRIPVQSKADQVARKPIHGNMPDCRFVSTGFLVGFRGQGELSPKLFDSAGLVSQLLKRTGKRCRHERFLIVG